jgi:DnaJ family protein C protein 2
LCDRLEGITEIAGQAEYLRNVISGLEPLSVMDSSATLAMKTAPQAAQIFSPLPPTSTGMKGSQTEVEKPPVEVRGQEKKVTGVLNAGEKKEKPWSKEEVDLLRKAVIKFPKGTSQRWEVVSNYVGTGRSVEEILKAVKTVLMQKPDSTKAFDSFLQTRKTGNVVINSPLSTREDEAGDLQAGKAASKPVANGSARAGEKTQKGIEEKSGGKSVTEENEDSQKYTQSTQIRDGIELHLLCQGRQRLSVSRSLQS